MNFMQNSSCPRCGQKTYERLQSYAHCWECNFSSEDRDCIEDRKSQQELEIVKKMISETKQKGNVAVQPAA